MNLPSTTTPLGNNIIYCLIVIMLNSPNKFILLNIYNNNISNSNKEKKKKEKKKQKKYSEHLMTTLLRSRLSGIIIKASKHVKPITSNQLLNIILQPSELNLTTLKHFSIEVLHLINLDNMIQLYRITLSLCTQNLTILLVSIIEVSVMTVRMKTSRQQLISPGPFYQMKLKQTSSIIEVSVSGKQVTSKRLYKISIKLLNQIINTLKLIIIEPTVMKSQGNWNRQRLTTKRLSESCLRIQ